MNAWDWAIASNVADWTTAVAASEIATMKGQELPSTAQSLDREAQRFQSRLQLLRELELIDSRSLAASACDHFAHLLAMVAKASHSLQRDGRSILAATIFDGNADAPGLLRDLATQVHARDDREVLGGHEDPGSDGQGVLPAFDASPETAMLLRKKLADASWRPSVNQSLRMVMPWIGTELGWSYVEGVDSDGAPLMMMENDWGAHFDKSIGVLLEPTHPYPEAASWVRRWPSRFWRAEDHGDDPDNPQADFISPEDLSAVLFSDVLREFISRVSALVREMKPSSSLPH